MLKDQFSQEEILRMFYLSGIIIFIVVGIANTFTNISLWSEMILSSKVSAIFSNLFNYVLAIFFFFLRKGMNVDKIKPIEDETLDEIFKEVSK